MLLTNQHSFHRGIRLQNATAFPAAHYQALNNLGCVAIPQTQPTPVVSAPALNTSKAVATHTVSLPTVLPLRLPDSAQRPSTGIRHVIAPHTPPETVAHHKPVPVLIPVPAVQAVSPDLAEVAATSTLTAPQPEAAAKVQPAHLAPTPVTSPVTDIHSPTNPRMTWKPGHGVIEKVDKLTGEIVHLAEEYLQQTFPQKFMLHPQSN